MKRRCYDPTVNDYSIYGGRGIKVCDRWRNSFDHFLEDVGERPKGYVLDRIDNESNYMPSNCRWVSAKESARNRRNNRIVICQGKPISVAEAAEILGVKYSFLYMRFSRLLWPKIDAFKIAL